MRIERSSLELWRSAMNEIMIVMGRSMREGAVKGQAVSAARMLSETLLRA